MTDPNLMSSISRRAYEIWESEGRPEGRSHIHWLRAEAEFREKFGLGFSTTAMNARPRLQPAPAAAKPAKPKTAKPRSFAGNAA